MADERSNIGHFHFENDEEALQFPKSRADDIAEVAIPVGGPVTVLPTASPSDRTTESACVFMMSGDIHLLRSTRAELILNDGFLNRMWVQIGLLEGQS